MADNIVLTGRLDDPLNGAADVGAQLRFTMVTTTGNSIQTATDTLIIPISGEYSITLTYGQIKLEYKTSEDTRDWTDLGTIVVNQDTIATTIPELIGSSIPPTDENILEFQRLLGLTIVAKDEAQAASAESIAARDAAKVSENNAAISSNASSLSATNAYNSEVLAGKYADNPFDEDVVPGRKSAYHWSEISRQFATGAISPGGLFEPKSGSEYPVVTGLTSDTIWMVQFPAAGDTYTYTFGDLSGQTATNAGFMYYRLSSTTWSYVPTANAGAVLKVDDFAGPFVNTSSLVQDAGDLTLTRTARNVNLYRDGVSNAAISIDNTFIIGDSVSIHNLTDGAGVATFTLVSGVVKLPDGTQAQQNTLTGRANMTLIKTTATDWQLQGVRSY